MVHALPQRRCPYLHLARTEPDRKREHTAMTEPLKWYAVREDDREDDSRSHTVSNNPDEHGWENDSGVDGYGLTWAQAKDIEGLSFRARAAEASELEAIRERDALRGKLQKIQWHEDQCRLTICKICEGLEELESGE